jgi:hypothetical protein
MNGMNKNRFRGVCFFGLVLFVTASVSLPRALASREGKKQKSVSRKVLTFYYPWYGIPTGPGGAGKTVHWGRIDSAGKDIRASTHYPALGAYDSHDPKLIDQHCRWAKQARIDTFIVSWWGHGSFSDRAMKPILEGCERHGLTACIYYETVPRPRTPESAAEDIIKVLNKYGSHSAHLKVDNRPVVFVYGRALGELGVTGWREAIEIINKNYKGGFVAMGDRFSYGAARVFDGIHTYNTAGRLRGLVPAAAHKWAAETYRSWVQLADEAEKISTLTLIPGYDDTKIRKPGLAVKRYNGELYRVQWEQAIKADPQWVLITSFNEWHEGSEIEPSFEYKNEYIKITGKYAERFKSTKRSLRYQADRPKPSAAEKAQLRQKLKNLNIGILPDADSMAFGWLLDIEAPIEVLTWEKIVVGLNPQRYPILLYAGGEGYRSSIHRPGDVDDALKKYLAAGGCLAALPSLPWPFYYDENGKAVNNSYKFGLTLRMGWESPPKNAKLHFLQQKTHLPHIPNKFAFPNSGDLRWRPFFAGKEGRNVSLLRLRDQDNNLSDAIAYAELENRGRIVYVWFRLLQGRYAEVLLYDIFNFVVEQMAR